MTTRTERTSPPCTCPFGCIVPECPRHASLCESLRVESDRRAEREASAEEERCKLRKLIADLAPEGREVKPIRVQLVLECEAPNCDAGTLANGLPSVATGAMKFTDIGVPNGVLTESGWLCDAHRPGGTGIRYKTTMPVYDPGFGNEPNHNKKPLASR